jgi:hypothetical protein
VSNLMIAFGAHRKIREFESEHLQKGQG